MTTLRYRYADAMIKEKRKAESITSSVSFDLDHISKTMAEHTGLLWDKLPEYPDAVCGHGMPEGCKQYWRELAEISNKNVSLANFPNVDGRES